MDFGSLIRKAGLLLLLAVLSLGATSLKAADEELSLGGLFCDHAVFQRNAEIPVWGWAKPGTEVKVTLNGDSKAATAGEDGKWTVWLKPLKAGGPYEMTVEGNKTITVKDIMIGDVWLCSGQSNMEWAVSNSNNFEEEQKDADYPGIRHFKVGRNPSCEPAPDVIGSWFVASPDTIGNWTAVGYFFGKYLHKHLNVPIGLLNSSWGGTRVEAWTSCEAVEKAYGNEVKGDFHNLSKVANQKEEDKAQYRESLEKFKASYQKLCDLEKDQEHQKKYSVADLDDADWKEIKTPESWENDGHPGLDGEVWYRKTIEIPAQWAGRDLSLCPGAVDEIETTFFNGHKVGEKGSMKPLITRFWSQPREHVVPGNLVKPGKAVIAIRVVDQAGGGGLIGPADQMKIFPKGSNEKGISLESGWKHKVAFALPPKPMNAKSPNLITVLYNGHINGLIPYAMTGAIWYQGESNAGNAYKYRVRFPTMINDWRERWNQGDFPFFWVSLANFRSPTKTAGDPGSSWAVVRESQTETLKLPNTGQAMAIDIGNPTDIHPRNKQDVGKRLALCALDVAYGEDVVFSGPLYKSMKVEDGSIRISFDHIGSGLECKGAELKQFAIAGEDGKFYWAKAVIDGDTVVVSSADVAKPVAVRYAWADNPDGCNLYNKEGLPAVPFRTDDWKVRTQP